MRVLSSIPIFGLETSGCHHNYKLTDAENKKSYSDFNQFKLIGCIPVVGFITGVMWIVIGVASVKDPQDTVEYPKLKGAACITRGVITMLGGGVLCTLADVATTVGRAARARLFGTNNQ